MLAWQPVVASVVLLAVSACFVDTGKSSTSDAASTPADDDGPAPTSAGPGETTAADPSTGSTADTADTADTAGTTAPTCQPIGAPCTDGECCGCLACIIGLCLPNDAACDGECIACGADGQCGQAAPGASCDARVDVDCTEMVWGVADGACYAMDKARPECTADGECIVPPCGEQGEVIVSCPECMLEENTCTAGTKAGQIDLASFCAVGNHETPGCASDCIGATVIQRYCDEGGVCREDAASCDPYVCDAGACATSCTINADCNGTADCIDGKCI
ncbi:MAG: hypothetical protein JNL82_21470 [Myxococcales bacterium]|nr:hypothetical protein [Myxococcales bacterium]